MKFDVFFSICQTEVNGYLPSERVMFENFFDQVRLADELEYETAWIAETHLSCETQKKNPNAVIPHFIGEIGLNTDILQMAHKVFAQTKNIQVGSAIRNILCNGGPIAHAEAVKTFLSLHGLNPAEKRRLHLGFASGRFEFSNRPYGIVPRNDLEQAAWGPLKGKILRQGTEIFLRLLKGETLSSEDIQPIILKAQDFRKEEEWKKVQALSESKQSEIQIPSYWKFEKLATIPFDVRLDLLRLVIGTHDPETQVLANQHLPVGVFNLSITPPKVIEETHQRMSEKYHSSGGAWRREYMPRTAMVFLNEDPELNPDQQNEQAHKMATAAWENYWKAMEGTLDSKKVEEAVGNALVGNAEKIASQIKQKYHPEDRLMLWFDFNNHDNTFIKQSMRAFKEKVVPLL